MNMDLTNLPSLTEEQKVIIDKKLTEENKPIPIRFVIVEANKREYEEYYRHRSDTYIPIWRKKTVRGFKTGARLLVMVADTGNWREQYLRDNKEYNCSLCEDTGVKHLENRWIPCSCPLGITVERYFYTPRTTKKKVYE